MPFSIERNDLALMDVDAVVITANEKLQITGGAGFAVAEAAGFERVQEACNAIGHCATGSAVATPAFDLSASTIVHVVGPVWHEASKRDEAMLRAAYDSALGCAADAGAHSIALPLISAGTYGAPPELSFSIAMDAIRDFLEQGDYDIRLVLYDRKAVIAALSSFDDIAEYIDDNYVEEHIDYQSLAYGREAPYLPDYEDRDMSFADEPTERFLQAEEATLEWVRDAGAPSFPTAPSAPASQAPPAAMSYGAPAPSYPAPGRMEPDKRSEKRGPLSRISELIEGLRSKRESEAPAMAALGEPASLGEWLDALDAPFTTTLLELIDLRGMTDAEVYKSANMSRQLFSKIRSDANYRPTKKTALALAIALKLDLDETEDLLRRAGYALSNSSKADVIVEYFIINGIYDIFAINEALYAFDQPLL